MAKIRVRGGTSRDDEPSLCLSCSYSHVYTDALGPTTTCNYGVSTQQMFGKVTSCNLYNNKSLPSKSEMETIAWTLRVSSSGKPIGFTAPQKEEA